MTITYHGNVVDMKFDVGDPSPTITLADGYSYETIVVTSNSGIYAIGAGMPIDNRTPLTLRFPPVNSHSPNTITPLFDNKKQQRFTFLITKFGQIPDEHYFDNAFRPILITGDDGNKYNVIPSDQFK